MRLTSQQAIELERTAKRRCPIHIRHNPNCSICARISQDVKALHNAADVAYFDVKAKGYDQPRNV